VTSPARTALVTGCSTGIGRATAARLSAEGWTVFATARTPSTLAGLTEAGCTPIALDLTDEASIRRAVDRIAASHGAVSVLVNNAGYSQSGAVEAVPLARVRAQFETNVFGPALLTQLVLPGMRRQRWGRIVNVGSIGGRLVFPGAGYYHATKYAIEALSDALRFEVEGFGIKVVLVEPGLVRTGFADAAVGTIVSDPSPEGAYRDFHNAVAHVTRESFHHGPVSRLVAEADDVAAVIGRAVADDRPRARYTVGASAPVFLSLRRVLGARLWDRFMARTYPAPGLHR